MKKIIVTLCTAFVVTQFASAQVAINNDGATPNTSAMLDIKSTSKGLLTPRMTTVQRNAIASPAIGLMVYDTDVNKFFYYAIGSWIEMGTGSATNYWTQNGTDIYNNNSGKVGIGVISPLATLDVMRGTALNGTALFRGTVHASNFNFGTAEDTYIRGGKAGSKVIINDEGLGNVGIGTQSPDFKLTVYESVEQGNTNTHVLKLKGQNPVLAFADQSENSYGYIKMWSYQPFAPYTNGMVIGANPGYPIFLSTNNYGATMTIADNGNVGINMTTPLAKLHINQNGEALRLSGSNPYLTFFDASNNYKGYMWNNTGNIEIGTDFSNINGEVSLKTKGVQGLVVQSDGRVKAGALTSSIAPGDGAKLPTFTVTDFLAFKISYDPVGEWAMYGGGASDLNFYYNGGGKAAISNVDGSWMTFSDFRLKENFEYYKPVLEGIKKLDVLTYHYKADKTGSRSFGLVAQNLQQYFPELVSGNPKNKDEYLAIAYGKTGVLAIKAIQEQQVIIETLEKKIEILEKRLAALESKLR